MKPGSGEAALHLHPADNVAIATMTLAPGRLIRIAGSDVRVRDLIPAGHKLATVDLAGGAPVRRYGELIGIARGGILAGQHVHTHNLEYRKIDFEYEFPRTEERGCETTPPGPVFLGYPRTDGRAGTRNYIAVVAASNCAARAAECIANHFRGASLPAGVDGVVVFTHGDGCGHSIGPDTEQLQRTLSGVADHPNVAGAVLVGLGCEVNLVDHYFSNGRRESERLIGLTLQNSGGTSATIDAGIAVINRYIERAADTPRVELPASKIVLGLNCGGSDSFSGVSANPALGVCTDLLVEAGGTAVLAETPEIFGAEHFLVRRARNRSVADDLLNTIEAYRSYLERFGGSFDDNPAPGNKQGGLTNIVEKSLGAVAKGGSSRLMGVVPYAGRVTAKGLLFMNTPGYDPISISGLAAGGCNLIAFTTGRGSGIGFPTLPVIKIATNTTVFESMRDNMDLNAGRILDRELSLADMGREIFHDVLEVASGKPTASERLGHREFVPWRIGPVL